jgi:hypothetical protein
MKILKSRCPVCNSEDKVYVYDHGAKFWRRLVAGNNRFACKNCKVTWRRKKPGAHTHLEKRNSMVTRTRSINRTYRRQFDFSKLKKNYKTYCIIFVVCAVFAYFLFGVYPHVVSDMMPKQGKETQSTVKKSGVPTDLRNDKKSGDLEMQKHFNGKKN